MFIILYHKYNIYFHISRAFYFMKTIFQIIFNLMLIVFWYIFFKKFVKNFMVVRMLILWWWITHYCVVADLLLLKTLYVQYHLPVKIHFFKISSNSGASASEISCKFWRNVSSLLELACEQITHEQSTTIPRLQRVHTYLVLLNILIIYIRN